MLPNAASHDLLYVSNLKTVTIYSYPRGSLEGTIDGFYDAQGECVDKKADVFVTNVGTNQILGYAHGARKRFRALAGHGLPEGCSIDPLTGDLAASDSDGTVAIYKNARGNPKVYDHTPFKQAFWCGYDDDGNLFVDGVGDDSANFVLAELPKNGHRLEQVTVNASMGAPGGVKWDGKYLAVGTSGPPPSGTPVVYRFKITGRHAKEVGTVPLGYGGSNVRQFWIQSATLIAPVVQLLESDVFFYKYPAGGKATKKITAGLDAPAGAVVSLAHGR